jgi:hypothetical protein
MDANVIAVQPADVAREVERLRSHGCRSFVLRAVANGGMLDRERLGAARYAAGVQAEVVLEAGAPAAVASPALRR